MKINVKKLLILQAELDISIGELAEKSGVSRNTLAAIKAGKTCRPEIVGKIARALGCNVTEILED